MMKASDAAIALIAHYEGFSPTPYWCAGGHLTIGYGHVIRADETFDAPLTELQARALLVADVAVAEQAVQHYITAMLTQGQYNALVSFTFNVGAGALQRSSLRRVVNRQAFADVPMQLRRWVYAGGKQLRGLVRRREAEIALWLS
jgi:lysozyme